MRFGRVEGFVRVEDGPQGPLLLLTVSLETGRAIETVREERLAPLRTITGIDDLIWHADQWTQETIGVDLAEAGWEVVGAGPLPTADPDQPASSAVYAVRNLG